MEYDDLLKLHVGEFGRYQKLVVAIAAAACITCAINNLDIVFLAAIPDHFCLSPTAIHLNLSREQLVTLTTPPEDHQCNLYDRQYSEWTSEQAIEVLNSTTQANVSVTQCTHGWSYDDSTYQSTIVTQWNLVCGRKALVPTAASVYMAGLMVGVLLFGYLADLMGRKIVLIISSLLMVVLAIATSFSPNYVTFIVLRFFLGMANLGLSTTSFVLSMEMVGPSWRVAVGSVLSFFWTIGYIIIAAVAYGIREWKELALVLNVPQALILIIIFFVPESPRWLYTKSRTDQADTYLRKMAKMNQAHLPENLKVEVKTNSKAYSWDLFRHRNLCLRTVSLFFIWFTNSMVYYGLSLNTSNLGGNDYINFFIAGAVEFPAFVFYQLNTEYFGRRKTLAGTMIMGGLSLLCISAVPSDLKTLIIVLAMIGKFCITVSFTVVYIFSAEIFPTVVRSFAVSGCSFSGRIGGIIAPYISSLASVNRVIPYVIFGTLAIISGILSLVLPETKGRKLPETIEDGEKFPHSVMPVAEKSQNGVVNAAFDEQPANIDPIIKY